MRDGDDGSFDEFVRAYSPALVRLAILLTGDRGHGEDLVQDVLERSYRRWPRIVRADDPVVYVRRSLVNAANSRWRRLGARVREAPLLLGHGGRQQADEIATADLRDVLIRALRLLPARQRTVLVLRYWADLTEAEIAAAVGCSAGAVKSSASRGLARLRGIVEPAAGGSVGDYFPIDGDQPSVLTMTRSH